MTRKTIVGRILGLWLVGLTLVCVTPASAQDAGPLRLSELVQTLSDEPGALDHVLAALGRNPAAVNLIGPAEREALRRAIAAEDWDWVDRFPNLSVDELELTLEAAARHQALQRARDRARQGQAGPQDEAPEQQQGLSGRPAGTVEPLGIPTNADPIAPGSRSRPIGYGLDYGDDVDPTLAAQYGDAARLSDVLNRLATGGEPVEYCGQTITTPEELLCALQATGHTIEVRDHRTFANFGDLQHEGRSVRTPFWIDTQIAVPGTRRTLSVPAAHSEHQLVVRGPDVSAETSFFFGVDGEAKFRPSATADQAWTSGRVANTYTGDDAVEAIRLAGEIRRVFEEKKARWPDVPFGGYYAFGVCNDANAILELHMTGRTTLYPLTRDLRYFQGPGEVDALARRLPVDREGADADLERVLGSLPVEDIDDLAAFPGLRRDLARLGIRGGQAVPGQQTSPIEQQTTPTSPIEQQTSPVEQQTSPTGQQTSPVEQQTSPVEQQTSPPEQIVPQQGILDTPLGG